MLEDLGLDDMNVLIPDQWVEAIRGGGDRTLIVLDLERHRYLPPFDPRKRATHWDEFSVLPSPWCDLTDPTAVHRLQATCPQCEGKGHSLTRRAGPFLPLDCEARCSDGRVDLGRFTVQIVPVVGDPETWPTERSVVVLSDKMRMGACTHSAVWWMADDGVYRPLSLDPLPQPGQHVAICTKISD